MKDIKITVGEEIRKARKQAGLSQLKLAALIGSSQPTLNAIEKGNRNISIEILNKIATALNMELEILIKKLDS